jgi:hypothetical protein
MDLFSNLPPDAVNFLIGSLIFGGLDPLYQDKPLFDRLVRVLKEDEDGNVRDAAFNSLMRLAAAPEEKTGE